MPNRALEDDLRRYSSAHSGGVEGFLWKCIDEQERKLEEARLHFELYRSRKWLRIIPLQKKFTGLIVSKKMEWESYIFTLKVNNNREHILGSLKQGYMQLEKSSNEFWIFPIVKQP